LIGHTYIKPSRANSLNSLVMSKNRKVVKLLQEEEDLLFTAAFLQLQIHIKQTEDKRRREEEEVRVGERLAAAQSALRSV